MIMFDLAKSNKGARVLIPEGNYVLKVASVEYKKALGRMNVMLTTKAGVNHFENFVFVTNENKVNQVAIDRFWWFAEAVMNDRNISDNGFDENELVGKYVKVTVKHETTPNRNDPDNPYTNARLNGFKPANGFENTVNNSPAVDPLDLL